MYQCTCILYRCAVQTFKFIIVVAYMFIMAIIHVCSKVVHSTIVLKKPYPLCGNISLMDLLQLEVDR